MLDAVAPTLRHRPAGRAPTLDVSTSAIRAECLGKSLRFRPSTAIDPVTPRASGPNGSNSHMFGAEGER